MSSQLWGSSISLPPITPPYHPCKPSPPPPTLPSPSPLPVQFRHVTTTSSPHVLHASPPPPHIGPEVIASQYTARKSSAFAKFMSPLVQTSPPLLMSPLRCTPTSCSASDVGSAPSVSAPPCIGNPQYPSHAGGDHPCLCTKNQNRLNNGFEEKSGHPRPCPLPAQDPRHSLPHRLCLHQVLNHRLTV